VRVKTTEEMHDPTRITSTPTASMVYPAIEMISANCLVLFVRDINNSFA